ncbi:MAG: hypothetical protein ACRDOL_14020 [Streptosporangiaceae bacterium]
MHSVAAGDRAGGSAQPGSRTALTRARRAAVYSFNPASATLARHPVPAYSTPWWVTAGQGEVWVALGTEAQGGLTEVDTVG